MYSFLITSRIKSGDEYDWYVYKGNKPVKVEFRGKSIKIEEGQKFGVRPSSSGKEIRLVFPNDLTRVITIDLATANKLANGIKGK
jgi:hypothetical protein